MKTRLIDSTSLLQKISYLQEKESDNVLATVDKAVVATMLAVVGSEPVVDAIPKERIEYLKVEIKKLSYILRDYPKDKYNYVSIKDVFELIDKVLEDKENNCV